LEARQTLSGNAVPKGLMIVLAICAAVALSAMGGYITRSLGGSSQSVVNVGHPAPGTVLRQDNPPVQSSGLIDRAAENQSQISAPVGSHTGRSSGTQIENSDFGLTADGHGSQSDLTRVLPTETQGYNPGWDARSVREGHGA
jgi:hypothetical protein